MTVPRMSRKTIRPRLRPVRTVAALCLAGSLGLAACSGGGTAGSTSTTGTSGAGNANGSFSAGVLGFFVAHLTPGGGANSFVDYALFTPLTRVDPNTKEVQMAVAESVTSTDQKVWQIKLKTGWTFTDGTPVTAQSFADAWNAAALGKNGWIGNSQFNIIDGYADLNPVEGEAKTKELAGVKVVDDQNLQVTLAAPNSMFPYILSGTTFAPMPASAFNDLEAYDAKPVGNGPYAIEGGGVGPGVQTLKLVRNDSYAGTKAHAKDVEIKLFQDANSLYTAFQGNAIDLALVDGTNFADARSKFGDRVVPVSYPAVVYLGFPLWDNRFKDVNVRKAFAMDIDRETISTALLRGSADPATTLAPASLLGADGVACQSCAYDPSAAKAALGGWTGKLELWTNDDPTQAQVLKAIANEFRTSLGITDVATQVQPIGQIYTNLAQKKINGPFLLYTGVTYPHLYTLTANLFTPGLFNVAGYANEQVSAELAAAAAAGTSQDAVAKSRAAAELALADVPLTPVYFPKGGLLHSAKVGNVVPEVLGGPQLAAVTVK
jgi:peptide/nickel transport system substrate-binding protein/oligopeptide transport system substrate-binding protein